MLVRSAPDLRDCDVTDHGLYLRRREFIAGGAGLAVVGAGLSAAPAEAAALRAAKRTYTVDEKPTSLKNITEYNNYYEFGTGKEDPAQNAGKLKTRPWTVVVDGECMKPTRFGVDDLIKRYPIEERIFRMRCVEAWSMVIPWLGFPLASLLKDVEPTAKAKFVSFETLNDPKQMPGVRDRVLDWPYREGLRIDEAMHPLATMAVGLYGQTLPNQNGAPIRLVVPWKYGFKSGKSVVRIRLQERQPATSWNVSNPHEYGFYSNVNPEVDHPRWSQASERRIGEFFRRKTLPFNGYADQVAGLYTGMDLQKNF